MNKAMFYKLLYHPAIYSPENGNIVREPCIMLGVKTIKKQILFFNIYPELCLAWQEATPLTTKKNLKWLESKFKQQLFLLTETKNLDMPAFEKKLDDIITFER